MSGAFGVYLDRIGRLVNEQRRDRDDVAYSAAIQVRILVNRSAGTTDDLLKIARLLVPASSIRYSEDPAKPAYYKLSSDLASPEVYATLLDALRQADNAGVGSDIVLGSGLNTIVFSTAVDGTAGRARGSVYTIPDVRVAAYAV